MNIWINPCGYNNAVKLTNDNFVSKVIVGNNEFCYRNNCDLTLEQIKTLNNDKVVVLINKWFEECELEMLTMFLKSLKEMNVKHIMFTDYAVIQICNEISFTPHFTYFSETLFTSYGQFDFFKENKIDQVVLSRELFSHEVEQIAKNKKVNIQIQVDGYSFMMHSKWNILKEFCEFNKIEDNLLNKKMYIKENERTNPNISYEDKHGFHLFGGFNLSLIKHLQYFIDIGIDSFRIDSFMHDEQWIDRTLSIYKIAKNFIDSNNYIKQKQNEMYEQIQNINIEPVSESFFGGVGNLIHLNKKEAHNE